MTRDEIRQPIPTGFSDVLGVGGVEGAGKTEREKRKAMRRTIQLIFGFGLSLLFVPMSWTFWAAACTAAVITQVVIVITDHVFDRQEAIRARGQA